MTNSQKPSLTSCIRIHEAGHAVVAFELGGYIEYVGAKGRATRMRLPNRQWVEHEGICLSHWFADYDALTKPVKWTDPEIDPIIKDIAALTGGIWAHKHYAGIDFDEAAEMGGASDLAAIDLILGFLTPNIRATTKDLARAVCRTTLKSNWAVVRMMADQIKHQPVISGEDAHYYMAVAGGCIDDYDELAKLQLVSPWLRPSFAQTKAASESGF